jgi:hypothetical protein
VKVANCPGCGAAITFQSSISVQAICAFCRTTVVRHDLDIENLGKMAEVLEDYSPLQIGASGMFGKSPFTVVGRIQLRYGAGVWNEWYVAFADGKTGWLSDAAGNYTLTFPEAVKGEAPPDFQALGPGQVLTINGQAFQVMDIEEAECVAGQGELPFRVGAGWAAPLVDLQGNDGLFASLDYSDSPPRFYLGYQVQAKALKLGNLREVSTLPGMESGPGVTKAGKVKAFDCPNCGSPITLRAEGTEVTACVGCQAVIDATDPEHQILSKYKGRKVQSPLLPLGHKGKLFGKEYEVIGYLRRAQENYQWSEYLLYNPREGFRWLTEYNGHWNFVSPVRHGRRIADKPQANGNILQHLGRDYHLYARGTSTVAYVLGEFYWRVRVGERTEVQDYISPPYMLSAEQGEREIVWSFSEYVEPEVIWKAFQPPAEPPERIGIYPNQPSRAKGDVGRIFKWAGAFTCLLLFIHLIFLGGSAKKTVFLQQYVFVNDARLAPYAGIGQGALGREVVRQVIGPDPAVTAPAGTTNVALRNITTPAFELKGRRSNVVIDMEIDTSAPVNNSWLYLDMALINATTGTVYEIEQELSYFSGSDDEDTWSEGTNSEYRNIPAVPAGSYYLSIDGEVEGQAMNTQPVPMQIRVVRDAPVWNTFFATLVFLYILPLIAWWRSRRYEKRRWADSDFSP